SSLTPNPGCPTTNDSPPSTPGSIATTLDAPTPLSVADPQPPDSPPNCQQPPGSVHLARAAPVRAAPVIRTVIGVRRYRWWMVAALAVTSTAGYGVLTYAFAVLLVPMQEALCADRTAITGAQTASLLAAALAAVPAGRLRDRSG